MPDVYVLHGLGSAGGARLAVVARGPWVPFETMICLFNLISSGTSLEITFSRRSYIIIIITIILIVMIIIFLIVMIIIITILHFVLFIN